MGIKSMLQRWLGVQPQNQKPTTINPTISATRPIGFPTGRASAKDVSDLYKCIGGSIVFAECLHFAAVAGKPWYRIVADRQLKRFVLYHYGVRTTSGQPMRKYLPCQSEHQGQKYAEMLLSIYNNDISRFS